jgi:hypothetical protein
MSRKNLACWNLRISRADEEKNFVKPFPESIYSLGHQRLYLRSGLVMMPTR